MAKETKKQPTGSAPAATVKPEQTSAVDWATEYQGQATGFENVKPEDLGIPYLDIVQSKSAEFDVTHPEHAIKKIEGVKPGDLINTVTREILASYEKSALSVVPCWYEKTYVEYKVNGGFVKAHRNPAIMDEVTGRDEKNRSIMRNGNQLVEYMNFYVLLLRKDEKPAPMVVSLSSSGLKHGRLWINLMQGIRVGPQRVTPPMFSHIYCLKTVIERKDNNSWFGLGISCDRIIIDRDLVMQAAKVCEKGLASSQRLLSAGSSQAALPPAAKADDDVPM